MSRRFILLVAVLASFMLAASVQAGGWVVLTLDSLPGEVRAGEPVQIGFVVRQHGKTLINSVSPILTVRNRDTGETITADADQVGQMGHFEVTVVFPKAGEWEWELMAPPFPQRVQFEQLHVLPARGATEAPPSDSTPDGVRAAMRWAGVVLVGVAAAMALMGWRREERAAAPVSAAQEATAR